MPLMKEIEFRAKPVTTGGWVYGHYAFVDGYHVIYENNRPLIIQLQTLGQYTGLRDSNHRKIYEGDILKISGREIANQVVVFEEGFYCTDEFALFELVRDNNRTFEVIGNIYEHADLVS